MSAIIGLMLASALSQASLANGPRSWMSDSDYPAGALKRREEGTVGYIMLLSPQGRATQCRITESSGSSELDARTCAIMSARMKFKAATDEMGTPAYSLWNGRLTWHLPGKTASSPRQFKKHPPDLELQVKKLPDGALEKSVSIIMRVDPSGQVLVCDDAKHDRDDAKLVQVACTQASTLSLPPVKDNDGNPVSLIRSMQVSFKVVP